MLVEMAIETLRAMQAVDLVVDNCAAYKHFTHIFHTQYIHIAYTTDIQIFTTPLDDVLYTPALLFPCETQGGMYSPLLLLLILTRTLMVPHQVIAVAAAAAAVLLLLPLLLQAVALSPPPPLYPPKHPPIGVPALH